jgi:DNA-binding XRE family transcriptional regulator
MKNQPNKRNERDADAVRSRVREWANTCGLNREQIAAKAGISKRSLYSYLAGYDLMSTAYHGLIRAAGMEVR